MDSQLRLDVGDLKLGGRRFAPADSLAVLLRCPFQTCKAVPIEPSFRKEAANTGSETQLFNCRPNTRLPLHTTLNSNTHAHTWLAVPQYGQTARLAPRGTSKMSRQA